MNQNQSFQDTSGSYSSGFTNPPDHTESFSQAFISSRNADKDLSSRNNVKIKCIGVGGGGMNAVERMESLNLRGIDFIAMNTDEQVLEKSNLELRIPIGSKVTSGMGSGGDPELGEKAALEDKESIKELLQGTDMLFITAGMGGGTGTGAAPIIASLAREEGILVVAVVTMPFLMEGKRRTAFAQIGLDALRQQVDTLITIQNESIFKIIDPKTSIRNAFHMIDEILLNAVRGISNIIHSTGFINVDFADVRSVMQETGDAIMGAGEGKGENKVKDAIQQAIYNDLLEKENSIQGATALLINVSGGEELGMLEWKEVTEEVTKHLDEQANVIVGLSIEDDLHDALRIVVIATKFKNNFQSNQNKQINESIPPSIDVQTTEDFIAPHPPKTDEHSRNTLYTNKPALAQKTDFHTHEDSLSKQIDENDLEIPTFMRKRNSLFHNSKNVL